MSTATDVQPSSGAHRSSTITSVVVYVLLIAVLLATSPRRPAEQVDRAGRTMPPSIPAGSST